VIREDHPCHLYFDLEFDRQANPSVRVAPWPTRDAALLGFRHRSRLSLYQCPVVDSCFRRCRAMAPL
jgi:hypothetical protein